MRAAVMAATCWASEEAARTAAAAEGAEDERTDDGSGLGTMAMEEVLLSASSRDGGRAGRTAPDDDGGVFLDRTRRGLVPFGCPRLLLWR